MKLTVFDGATSIGGTKILLETGYAGIILDFGMNFKHFGAYYADFLRPRRARGIWDLWWLGLLPRHPNLYRADLMPPDFRPDGNPLDVELILISHPHMDHCGLLGTIRADIPVGASPAGWAVLKAMQDTGKFESYQEAAYISLREPQDQDSTIKSQRGTKDPYRGREIRFVGGEASSELRDFLTRSPNPTGRPIEPGTMESLAQGPHKYQIHGFPVDHSVPGALAYTVETDAGWVVYTGDLRLQGRRRQDTLHFVEEAKRLRPRVLIIEGTRATRCDPDTTTEQDTQSICQEIVSHATGQLVIADFGPRQVDRLRGFLEIAQATGRKLLILTRDMYLLEALALCDETGENIIASPHLAIYDDPAAEPRPWDKGVRERYRSRMVKAKDVQSNPGSFILAFSLWDLENLLDIQPKGGLYIYSSSEAHNEEQILDIHRISNWLQFFNVTIYGFHIDEGGKLSFQPGFHASGHAAMNELLGLVKEIKPKVLIPVHTESPQQFTDGLRGEPVEVKLVPNGGSIRLV